MGEAYFYHLTDSPLEAALPLLIERARGAGWRVVVRAPDAGLADMLDAALWRGPDERFLPHGRAGGPHDALQPVLLCVAGKDVANGATSGVANRAECLMTVAGAAVSPADISAFARTCILFDGHDDTAVGSARAQWKTLTTAGAAAQYWAQQDGRWVKKAESAATGSGPSDQG